MSCFTPRGERGRVVEPADAVFGLLSLHLWTDSHDGKIQITAELAEPADDVHTTETGAKRALLAYLRELERDVRRAIATIEAEVSA